MIVLIPRSQTGRTTLTTILAIQTCLVNVSIFDACSGLKLIPSDFDDEIGNLEDKIEAFAARTGAAPREVFRAALERFVVEVIDRSPPQ